ncbi:conserved hypothetical protein [Pseudomonas sp. 8BK]|uniref:MarR family transcriptional regulator n=1 Tax=Pseudomonas sp. 8BK TaxID=2653164 RepID=UPI0012F390AB|nr:MarR family transcriptional regulator [Pseudomonas sp. 8BK]VXC38488.1 conserved hypothetical protein [Pseudomonas sp. 8BK]
MSEQRIPEWSKVPIVWIQKGGLTSFSARNPKVPFASDEKGLINSSIAALRLYLVICCSADFRTGLAQVTYDRLVKLAHLSRPIVSKGLKRLEAEGLIRRIAQPLKKGTMISITGWLDDDYYGRIPKRWLFDGSPGIKMLRLTEFVFSKASLSSLKVYMTLLAYRDGNRGGLAILSYDRLSQLTGVGRHQIADAITMLYHMDLISFRQADYSETKDRTNRYLVRGIGSYWDALSDATVAGKIEKKVAARPSKAAVAAANQFRERTPK